MGVQNDYAQLLAKRVNEEKAKKTELRSMSMTGEICIWVVANDSQSEEHRR